MAVAPIVLFCICLLSCPKQPQIPVESTQVRPTNQQRTTPTQPEDAVFYNGLADLVAENRNPMQSPTSPPPTRYCRDKLIRESLEFRRITLPSPLETFELIENSVLRQEQHLKNKEPRQQPDLEEGTASQSTDDTETSDEDDGKISSNQKQLFSSKKSSFRSFFAFVRGLSDLQHHQECCSICLEPYQVGDVVARMKNQNNNSDQKEKSHCKHWFHEDCIVAWLKNHDECPLCRVDIIQS